LLLPLVDCLKVTVLYRADNRHVADAVIMEWLGVFLPYLNADPHHFAHRRLKIEVTNHAAGDARCAGARPSLIQHHNIRARTFAARLEFFRQVPGSAETMHPRR
jgi:hypothetical protein